MSRDNKKPTSLLTHLVAGGSAGFMEACTCHPLDTVKVRMQLSRNHGVTIVVNPTSRHLLMMFILGQETWILWCWYQDCKE